MLAATCILESAFCLEVQNILWDLRGLARARGALDDAHLKSRSLAFHEPVRVIPAWFCATVSTISWSE